MLRLRVWAGVLVLAFASTGFLCGDDKPAEKKDDAPPKVKGQLPANWKKLGLTDDQTQKVYKISADYRSQIDELTVKIKKLQAEEKAEMFKVLTDGQKTRLKELAEAKSGVDSKPDEKKPTEKKSDDKKPEEKKP